MTEELFDCDCSDCGQEWSEAHESDSCPNCAGSSISCVKVEPLSSEEEVSSWALSPEDPPITAKPVTVDPVTLARMVYLLKAVSNNIGNQPELEWTRFHYDDTICDGFCLKDDIDGIIGVFEKK